MFRVTKLALRHNPSRVLATRLPTIRSFSSSTWDAGETFRQSIHQDGAAKPWQAEGAMDIQRVTQTALIHELVQQQTNTIQSIVPWFLESFPPPYFRQVPEKFRVDHIKAIAAIKGTFQNARLLLLFYQKKTRINELLPFFILQRLEWITI